MASEWISILVDGQDMRAYLSQPETTGKVPGVIVIMEAFGVNKHIQEVTDKLSRESYVAMAPVLYHRLGSNPLFSYTGDDVRTIQAELKKHSKICDFKIYPGANHGFHCDERPSYHAEAARDAWRRTLDWFQTYLKA